MHKYKKTVLYSVLAIALGFGTISPGFSASANELPPEEFMQDDSLLDSDELIGKLMESATDFSIVEAYARNATIQTQTVFEKIEEISVGLELVQPIQTHLEDIENNAKRWLDDIKPQLLQTTQNMISFTNKFEVFTTPLRDALELEDETEFVNGIRLLESDVDKYEEQAQLLADDLGFYRDDLTEILGTLNSDFSSIYQYLEADGGALGDLREDLETLEAELDTLNALVRDLTIAIISVPIGGLILGGLITFMPFPGAQAIGVGLMVLSVGGGLVGIGAGLSVIKKQQKDKRDEIREATRYLGAVEAEYALLTDINIDLETTYESVANAQEATEGLKENWENVKTKFATLRESIEELDWEESRFILPYMIDYTEKEAQDINEFAKALQLNYQYEEEVLSE